MEEVTMAIDCDLVRMVKDVSRPLGTRDEVIAYFKKRYPEEKQIKSKKSPTGYETRYEWKKKLVDARMELEPGAKRESVNRQFQNDKKTGRMRYEASKPSPTERARYRALGATLPHIPPSSLHIEGTLCMRYLDDPCEDREFDITMEGKDLKFFLETYDLQSIVNVYMDFPADYGLAGRPNEDPSMLACSCPGNDDCEWDLTISAMEEPAGARGKNPSKGYAAKSVRGTLFKGKKPKKGKKTFERGPTLTPDQVTDLLQ
jgi:hypothetical protein